MTGDPVRLLPVYLLLGVREARRDDARAMLVTLRDELAVRPTTVHRIRLGLIVHGTGAEVALPLCDPLDPALDYPPPLGGGGAGMDVGAALTVLAGAMAEDSTRLSAEGFVVERPLVWLVVDGPVAGSAAERAAAHLALTGNPGYPHIVACGLDGAAEDVLRALVHPADGAARMRAYLGGAPADLGSLGDLLLRTVLATVAGSADRPGPSDVALPTDHLPAGVRLLGQVPFQRPDRPV